MNLVWHVAANRSRTTREPAHLGIPSDWALLQRTTYLLAWISLPWLQVVEGRREQWNLFLLRPASRFSFEPQARISVCPFTAAVSCTTVR